MYKECSISRNFAPYSGDPNKFKTNKAAYYENPREESLYQPRSLAYFPVYPGGMPSGI